MKRAKTPLAALSLTVLLSALAWSVVSFAGGDSAAGGVPAPIKDCTDPYACAARTTLAKQAPIELKDTHNVFRLSEKIISGGEPLSDDGLRALAKMGIKTLLSVDGKTPNAKLAAELGMRYVHVPIRYGGIKKDEVLKIAKTFREMKPPFYVHCFHGKHRGPAAAAVGRVLVDGVSREQALAEMRQWSGTAKKYTGLYGSIATGQLPAAKVTAAFKWDFPAADEAKGVRVGMIRMTRTFDNVKWLAKREWKTDAEHPDIDPVNESEKLLQQFEVMAKIECDTCRPDDYKTWMKASLDEARGLATALEAFKAGDKDAASLASKKLVALKGLCSDCHKPYRNK